MNQLTMIRGLFVVAGLYDGLFGLGFLLAAPALYLHLGIPAPNHWGYVHFPALLLIVFAAAFFAVARNPVANRNLIVYGVMLKLSYCGTVLYHWWADSVPAVWKPFVLVDLLFLVLFLWAYSSIGRLGSSTANPGMGLSNPSSTVHFPNSAFSLSRMRSFSEFRIRVVPQNEVESDFSLVFL